MRFTLCLLCALSLAGFAAAQDTDFASGPQYLITSPSPMFLHSIATPSLSFGPSSAVAPPVATQDVTSSRVVETPAPLPSGFNLGSIYWGVPQNAADTGAKAQEKSSEIELSASQPAQPLPESIMDLGVTGMVTPQTLRQEGYGQSLGQVAAYWKAHKTPVAHVYTNKDIQRVHGA